MPSLGLLEGASSISMLGTGRGRDNGIDGGGGGRGIDRLLGHEGHFY